MHIRALRNHHLIGFIVRTPAAPTRPGLAAAMTSSGTCLPLIRCPCAARSPAPSETGSSRRFRGSCRHRLTEAQASGWHSCTATRGGDSLTTSPVAPRTHRRCSIAPAFLQGRELLSWSSCQTERKVREPRAACAPAGYPAGCLAQAEASGAVCRCGSSFDSLKPTIEKCCLPVAVASSQSVT